VSNLGKYLPGKVWQIGAMGAMSRELGVSPLAATGSAILGALVNVLTGFVVVLVAGRPLLDRLLGERGDLATAAIVTGCAALLASPWIIPRVAPLVARATGRAFEATLPARAIVYSLIGNIVAWLLYGYAFQLFVRGMLGGTTGGYSEYLAAYTFSYVAGYVALFAPAGAGVREGFMLEALKFAGLATSPQAALVTITSRVWLTLLEVTPGVLFWAHHRARRR
jgi:glycosyltransferase 2 family protein